MKRDIILSKGAKLKFLLDRYISRIFYNYIEKCLGRIEVFWVLKWYSFIVLVGGFFLIVIT